MLFKLKRKKESSDLLEVYLLVIIQFFVEKNELKKKRGKKNVIVLQMGSQWHGQRMKKNDQMLAHSLGARRIAKLF